MQKRNIIKIIIDIILRCCCRWEIEWRFLILGAYQSELLSRFVHHENHLVAGWLASISLGDTTRIMDVKEGTEERNNNKNEKL